jgi:chromate transport protein ChrA
MDGMEEGYGGRLPAPAIFAAARLTPGTNLIALFVGLGRHLHGVRGAIAAVIVGLAPAVAVSVLVCALSLRFSGEVEVSDAIAGASAAAMSVLAWAALKFLWKPMRSRSVATLAMIVTVIGLQVVGVPSLVLLVASFLIFLQSVFLSYSGRGKHIQWLNGAATLVPPSLV